jgi:diguanylate cyclase
MKPETDSPSTGKSRLPNRIYPPRVIGLALGGICVAAGIFEAQRTEFWVWTLLLLNAVFWPHLAHGLAIRSENPRQVEIRNLMLDSLFGGFWIVAMQANPLPSVLILAMLSMNNVATGGYRSLIMGLAANLLGGVIGWGLFGLAFQPVASYLVQIACIPFLIVYPILIGMVTLKLAHQLNCQRKELRRLSEYDPLSGLYNRRVFQQRMAEEFEKFKRYGASSVLAIADIDHFKNINDKFGHLAGDAAIRLTGEVFRGETRCSDITARIGGDEFVVLMPVTNIEEALILLNRLQRAFALAVDSDEHLLGTKISFGVAAPNPEMKSHEAWIESADLALYRAKTMNRGGVEIAAGCLI